MSDTLPRYALWACWLLRDDGSRRLAAVGPQARCERTARHLEARGLRAHAHRVGRVTVADLGELERSSAIDLAA